MPETTVETSTEIIIPEIQAFSPDVFDPRKEQLQEIADEVAKIEADPAKMDKDTLTLVNATKNKLVKARTTIEKTGKALRDPHTEFNRAVSSYENELIAIIEPQEKRLKAIEEDAKKIAIREERRLTLPEYKAKLTAIGDPFIEKFIDEANYDEYLLTLDPNQRDAYYNERLGAYLQAQKAEADAKAAKEAEEKEAEANKVLNKRREILIEIGFKSISEKVLRLELVEAPVTLPDETIRTMTESEFLEKSDFWRKLSEAQKASDIKAAEAAAEAKAKEEAKTKAAAEEAKRLADEEAAKKAKEEQEAKEAAELAARQSAEAFQKWTSDNSYNSETDTLIEDQDATGKVTILYREVSRYTHTS